MESVTNRQIHPRCRGVALKLAQFFQYRSEAVTPEDLIRVAGLSRPNIEGAIVQGLLERSEEKFTLSTYAESVLYR